MGSDYPILNETQHVGIRGGRVETCLEFKTLLWYHDKLQIVEKFK